MENWRKLRDGFAVLSMHRSRTFLLPNAYKFLSPLNTIIASSLSNHSCVQPQTPLEPPPSSNHHPLFKTPRHSRRSPLQIHPLHHPLPFLRLMDQVPKILPRNLALMLPLPHILPLGPEILDAFLQAGAQVLGGEFEYFADFGGNAQAVSVGVVEGMEGCGDAAGEAGREGGGD